MKVHGFLRHWAFTLFSTQLLHIHQYHNKNIADAQLKCCECATGGK